MNKKVTKNLLKNKTCRNCWFRTASLENRIRESEGKREICGLEGKGETPELDTCENWTRI